MGIKPALGWLGLLLFTTAAQAEGTRELLKPIAKPVANAPLRPATPPAAPSPRAVPASVVTKHDPVTPKTKAAPRALTPLPAPGTTTSGTTDYYEVDVHGTAPDAAARVRLFFEHEERPSLRIEGARLERVTRLAGLGEHLDVVETDDAILIVDTTLHRGGAYATSDVYTFARHAGAEARASALEMIPAPARDRIRDALETAKRRP